MAELAASSSGSQPASNPYRYRTTGTPLPNDDFPELSVHHVGVSVPDIDASIAWYGKMFGLTLEMRQHLPLIPAEIAFLRRGALRIELFQVNGAATLPPDRREPNRDVRTHGTKHCAMA